MGGVAQQRHAAEAPARDRIAIGHGKLEHDVALAKEARHVQPVEAPVPECRHEVGLPALPVPLLPAPVRLALVADLGHPVDQGGAALRGLPRDRIDHGPDVPVAGDGHRPAIEEGLLLADAAPHRDAGEPGRPLAGIQQPTDRRVDAVGPDQRVAASAADGRTGRGIDEPRRHPVVVLLEVREAVSGPDGRRAQARPHGAGEDRQQAAAMDRELGPPVAGSQAARLALDQPAVPRVVGQRSRLDRRGRELGLQTQRAQLAHRVRQEIDADAELPQRGRGLVDDGLDTCPMKAERRRQPPDAAADDENAHRLSRRGVERQGVVVPAPPRPHPMSAPARSSAAISRRQRDGGRAVEAVILDRRRGPETRNDTPCRRDYPEPRAPAKRRAKAG